MATDYRPAQPPDPEPDDDDDGPWLKQIGEGTRIAAAERRKLPGYFLVLTSVRVAIIAAAVACVYAAYHLPQDSYTQNLAGNAAVGFGIFFFAAPMLRAMRSWPRTTLLSGAAIVAAILGVASIASPLTESLLLGAGVGFALLLALDLNIARWLDAIVSAEDNARKRIDEAARLVEQAETALDYKYAVHDYLNLPRPDKLGGIRLPEGETLMGALGWPDKE
ncbi:MAG TPA: hypothetical protein VN650_17430 [Gemmatimonadaceae bacterium]|nr:hypothetical protein [Gemmatimonadaceae bacterium]